MKLGYPGGQTVFDITTFMESVKVDEKLNYDQGFILPGAVHLLYASVKSKSQQTRCAVCETLQVLRREANTEHRRACPYESRPASLAVV